MIYTCYEMVLDCRTDLPEGWAYFISEYVPLIRKLLAHYDPERAGDDELLNRILLALRKPESSMFQLLEPAPERWFAAELRQKVLAELARPVPRIAIDLATGAAALEPRTAGEEQAARVETIRYNRVETDPMRRMEPGTVAKIRT